MIISKDLFIFGEHIFGTFTSEPLENVTLSSLPPMPPSTTEAQAQHQQPIPKYRSLGNARRSDAIPLSISIATKSHIQEEAVTKTKKDSKDRHMYKRHSISALSVDSSLPVSIGGDAKHEDIGTLLGTANRPDIITLENLPSAEYNSQIDGSHGLNSHQLQREEEQSPFMLLLRPLNDDMDNTDLDSIKQPLGTARFSKIPTTNSETPITTDKRPSENTHQRRSIEGSNMNIALTNISRLVLTFK